MFPPGSMRSPGAGSFCARFTSCVGRAFVRPYKMGYYDTSLGMVVASFAIFGVVAVFTLYRLKLKRI